MVSTARQKSGLAQDMLVTVPDPVPIGAGLLQVPCRSAMDSPWESMVRQDPAAGQDRATRPPFGSVAATGQSPDECRASTVPALSAA